MHIEVITTQPNDLLKEWYQKDNPDIGESVSLSDGVDIRLIQGGEENLLGSTLVWVTVKILLAKFGVDAKAILAGVIANKVYDALKKLKNPQLKIENQKVEIDKEQIKLVIQEYIKQQTLEEE